MQKGDIVKFNKVVDAGDEALRMVLLENPDRGSVLVEAIVDMNIKPTYRHNVEDLEVCGEIVDKLKKTIERMKREVLDDVKSGQVPSTVKTFAELHDYVDANEYGGFCEDKFTDSLIEHFGGLNEETGMPQEMLDFMNAAQNAIDTWIKEGGLLE
jgi:hypothetical protein